MLNIIQGAWREGHTCEGIRGSSIPHSFPQPSLESFLRGVEVVMDNLQGMHNYFSSFVIYWLELLSAITSQIFEVLA